MKYNHVMAFVMLAGLLLACSKTESSAPVSQSIVGEGKVVTLSATLPEESKAYVDNAGSFTWANGDAIGVFVSDGNTSKCQQFTLVSGAGKKSASFSATLEDGYQVIGPAVYPFHNEYFINESKPIVSVQISEYIDWYGNTQVYCPMAAVYAPGSPLTFRHTGAVIRLTIDDFPTTANRLRFKSTGYKAWGTFELDMSVEEPRIETIAGSNTTTIVKLDNWNKQPGGSVSISIPVPSGDFGDISFEAYNNSAPSKILFSRASSKSRNLSRGTLLCLPKVSEGVPIADFEGGIPAYFTATSGANAILSLKDNPAPSSAINASSKVLGVSTNDGTNSGKVTITVNSSTFHDGVRNGTVGMKFKVFFKDAADVSKYCPRLRFSSEGSTYKQPSYVNGEPFSQSTWIDAVRVGEWNTLVYIGNAVSSGIFELAPYYDMSGNAINDSGRMMYFDDFVLVK